MFVDDHADVLLLADPRSHDADPRHREQTQSIADAHVTATADLPADHAVLQDDPVVRLRVGILVGEFRIGGGGFVVPMFVEAEVTHAA